MKTKIIQNLKSIILALILVAGVSYVSAYSAWKNPTTTPPGNNVDAPLNVGTDPQSKTGALTIGDATAPTTGYVLDVKGTSGLASFKGMLTQAFTMPTGAAAGKVLTSDADGSASWQDPTGGTGMVGGGAGTSIIACNKTGNIGGNVRVNTEHRITFTASDCGGTLPTSDYVGILNGVTACWGALNPKVLNAGEQSGPGVRFDGNAPANNLNYNSNYTYNSGQANSYIMTCQEGPYAASAVYLKNGPNTQSTEISGGIHFLDDYTNPGSPGCGDWEATMRHYNIYGTSDAQKYSYICDPIYTASSYNTYDVSGIGGGKAKNLLILVKFRPQTNERGTPSDTYIQVTTLSKSSLTLPLVEDTITGVAAGRSSYQVWVPVVDGKIKLKSYPGSTEGLITVLGYSD